MSRVVRDGLGGLLGCASIVFLGFAVIEFREHDYVAGLLMVIGGLSMLRGGIDLLRPSLGE